MRLFEGGKKDSIVVVKYGFKPEKVNKISTKTVLMLVLEIFEFLCKTQELE